MARGGLLRRTSRLRSHSLWPVSPTSSLLPPGASFRFFCEELLRIAVQETCRNSFIHFGFTLPTAGKESLLLSGTEIASGMKIICRGERSRKHETTAAV